MLLLTEEVALKDHEIDDLNSKLEHENSSDLCFKQFQEFTKNRHFPLSMQRQDPSPAQTAAGKDPIKSVDGSGLSKRSKELTLPTSPAQTVTGKGMTNPLMAGYLPKISQHGKPTISEPKSSSSMKPATANPVQSSSSKKHAVTSPEVQQWIQSQAGSPFREVIMEQQDFSAHIEDPSWNQYYTNRRIIPEEVKSHENEDEASNPDDRCRPQKQCDLIQGTSWYHLL